MAELASRVDLSSGPVVLMSDWNARLAAWQDLVDTPQGDKRAVLADELGLRQVNSESGRWTRIYRNSCSVLDHLFANEVAQPLAQSCWVLEGEALGGSDHRPLCASFRAIGDSGETNNRAPASWNRWKLKDPEPFFNFTNFLWRKAII